MDGLPLPVDWPAPRVRPAIVPVFLPFRGCAVRCIFCAQQIQTGVAPDQQTGALLDAARQRLEALAAPPTGHRLATKHAAALPELAFYGGTFTALPEDELQACLAFARRVVADGLCASFRCSTRPDCVSPAMLDRLRAAGCTTVELGVQSFADAALAQAKRGYDGTTAARACAAVRQAGLTLGVQLLPGMPGVTPDIFQDDVARALALGADVLRFYPCLVLRGTGLAALWETGAFVPWQLDTTVDALTRGWLTAHRARVPVIRMGLAPEAGLGNAIAAGPVHPALGDMVLGRGLLQLVREAMHAAGVTSLSGLDVPAHCQGFFWGHRRELAPAWQALGLGGHNVRFVA